MQRFQSPDSAGVTASAPRRAYSRCRAVIALALLGHEKAKGQMGRPDVPAIDLVADRARSGR